MTEQSYRLFIAIELSGAMKSAIKEVIETLRMKDHGAIRWVQADGMHLTLKFLGDVPESKIEMVGKAIENACAGVESLSVSLNGMGVFPNESRPRVLWIGLAGEPEALQRVQGKLDEECFMIGFAKEERAFSPHVTLGRMRDDASPQAMQGIVGRLKAIQVSNETHLVDCIALIKSVLGPNGPNYTQLKAVDLK